MTKEEQKEVLTLLDSYKYDDAITLVTGILEKENDEKDKSYLNYMMSLLYKNKNKLEQSNQYALYSISSQYPDPRAYKLYAETCDDKLKAINHLKQGLELFPQSSNIYQGLIAFLPDDEVEDYFKDIENKELNRPDLMHYCIKYKIERQQWDIIYFVDKLLSDVNYDKDYALYIKFLKGIAFVFKNDLKQAEEVLKECINSDLNNNLQFSAHIGLIWVYSLSNDLKNVKKYIKLIEFVKLTDFLEGPWYPFTSDFTKLFNHIESSILTGLRDNKEITEEIKVIFSLTRLSQFLYFGNVNFNKQDCKVIENFYKTHKEKYLLLRLLKMNSYFKSYNKLIELEIEYHKQGFDIDDFLLENCGFDHLTNKDVEQISVILNKELLKTDCEINESAFFKSFIDDIISAIWRDSKGTKEIYNLCKNFNDNCLLKSSEIFELAYSFRDFDMQKSKKLYEEILNQNEKNTSVLNNLAMIYESLGDIEKAFELLSKGKLICADDDIIKNNYKRINDYITKYKKGADNLKRENIYIISKLGLLVERSDEHNTFELAYKDKFKVLECSNDKADEIIKKLIDADYITKLKTEQYEPNKYQINPLVSKEINILSKRISDNKQYEEKASNVNLDGLEEIGYPQLNNKLNFMVDNNYKKISQRDLQECAISYLVGSYKSTIVLIGSLIEAILLDQLISKGVAIILDSKGKNKKIVDADLGELIKYFNSDPTLSNDLIKHLMEVARIYRNIVHPANEVKKDYIIAKTNADLSWSTLSIIINKLY